MTPEKTSNWHMTLAELVAGTAGQMISQVAVEFSGVGTDTRANLSGQIFIALKGDQFDAHDFLADAVKNGASALLVHRLPSPEICRTVTVVQVADTLKALQELGRFWRRKMPAQILGLTGTNGKTTSKEFAAALIGAHRCTHYSKGSLNNHWGVPLSLLALRPEHQVAVIEMGMNHPGELTELVRIAEPDLVLVTMVGRGHLQGLGSIEGVAAAKAEIYAASPAKARFAFNLENLHTRAMFERFGKATSLTFAGTAYVRANGVMTDVNLEVRQAQTESMTIAGQIRGVAGECEVPVFGAHNVTNLMVAAVMALAADLTPQEIWQSLPLCRTVWGRNQWVNLPGGAKVLFDGYNANPESMTAALQNFRQLGAAGRKFAVLGEMKEMGAHAAEVHQELGREVAAGDFAGVAFFGPSGADFAAGLKAGGYRNLIIISDSYKEELAPRMLPVLELGDLVLMKGSRGMQLEKALLALHPLDFKNK